MSTAPLRVDPRVERKYRLANRIVTFALLVLPLVVWVSRYFR